MKPLHDRMPVILPQKSFRQWLDPQAAVPGLQELLRPSPEGALTIYAVSSVVNSGRVDRPECVRPWETPGKPTGPSLWDE
jgi:putative SOS response-associated peptidase YedK